MADRALTFGAAGSASASQQTINDQDVDSFFKALAEGGAPNSNRTQKKRLSETANSFWRALVSGPTATPVAAGLNGGGGVNTSSPAGSSSSLTSTPTTVGAATGFRAAKEAQMILGLTQNEKTQLLFRPRGLANTSSIEVGRTTLSETEKWKLQAALRKEQQKASGEKYNQAMLRETKICKAPTAGEGFPAGRGRPTGAK